MLQVERIKMNARQLGAAILVAAIFLMPLGALSARAATITDLQKQKAALDAQIKDRQQQAAQKKKEADALKLAINSINKDIHATEGRIANTQAQIDDTNQKIAATNEQIKTKEQELLDQKENQNEALRVIYETGEPSTLEIIVGSNSLSEVMTNNDYLEALETKIEATIEEIISLKAELQSSKDELENQERDLSELQRGLEAYQGGLSQQKDQKSVLLSNTKEAQKQLEAQVADAKRAYDDINSELYKLQAATKRGIKVPDGVVSKAGFRWPVDDYAYITTPFGGSTPFQPNGGHTGIDIAGPAGDPIKAVASGTVILATKMCCSNYSGTVDGSYGYGNYIMIQHDNGLFTLYGHLMKMVVSAGDQVNQGSVIGYRGGALGMAGAGYSTGAHLHFEVRFYQENQRCPSNRCPVDPMSFLP